MENDIKFRDIFIGIPDGEVEAQNAMFEQLFCDYKNRYEELMKTSTKFLVIGSKGSGKTYLANYIYKQKKGYSKIISGKDFLVEQLIEITNKQSEAGYAYAFCSWYLYKKISEMILEKHYRAARWNHFSPYYKLKRFMDTYNDQDNIFKIIHKTVTNGKSKEYGAEGERKRNIKIKDIEDKTDLFVKNSYTTGTVIEKEKKYFFELLDTFKRLVLEAADKNQELCIIVDDLDELDRTINQDVDGNVTINLIKAAKEINKEFKEYDRKVKVILLVRSDIINKLQMLDMNLSKITKSCGVELYWLTNTQISPEQHPLMHLVLHKIKTSCPKLKDCSEKELFSALFPEKIDGKPPLDFLLDYSMGRPRDIISFLNYVIQYYPDSSTFTATELKEVRKFYSSDLYDELVNQMYYHRKPEYTKDCISLISGLKKNSFSMEQVKEYYEKNKLLFKNIQSVEEAMEFLYEMGAIGNVWNSGKNSSWAYRKDSLDSMDMTRKVTIHYGLRKKFSIS